MKEKPVRVVDWALPLMEAPMSDLSATTDILIAEQRLDAITHGGVSRTTPAPAHGAPSMTPLGGLGKDAMRIPDGLDPIHAAA